MPPKANKNKNDTASAADEEGTCSEPPPAQWMSGKWGIGWRIAAGDNNLIKNYNAETLVEQIDGIPGVGYVLFGLSAGAKGDRYIAPHSVLKEMNPKSCPDRDLFGELATAFQDAGYKVLAYMATEGPAKLKHGVQDAYDWDPETETAPSVDNWKSYVKDRYGSDDEATLKRAYAEVIVKEYAERYGSKIDGWWYDHSVAGNMKLIHEVCKKANPKTIMTFNKGKLPCCQNSNPGLEDYTFGHPTPHKKEVPSSQANLRMVKAVEKSNDGFYYEDDGEPSLAHLFMPMQETWNRGEPVFTEEQAVDWMSRVLSAGGAWTWNVPAKDGRSKLQQTSVDFASAVGATLELNRTGES
eukprot:CAMPEP_0183726230 /NCGR_PEP_ID=MMETSP0737-20130205/22818_1 /TAXON_ID=385413 /ORGANISM="Thalassiosira miniscula, Strain CCMP1093" /LENGTH=353 /DNA_ID=CAMNT_0025957517 /DNA_START=83 /DNA_END=1144 /DNA_ORIENTATION=+